MKKIQIRFVAIAASLAGFLLSAGAGVSIR